MINLILSEKHTILLKAILDKNQLIAFSEWKQKNDFERDIDIDSFKLLPLLYQKLCEKQIDDVLLPRLKGIYRKNWSNNQLIIKQLTVLITELSEQKITPLILPEAASAFLIYSSLAMRQIGRIDLAIKQNQIQEVIKHLLATGWRMNNEELHKNFLVKYGTKISFSKKNNVDITLHWYPDVDTQYNKIETQLWERSITFSQQAHSLPFISITDCFIYLIKNHSKDILNLTDIANIIISYSDKLNWELIITETKNKKFANKLNQVLFYLKKTFQIVVPDNIYQVLSTKKKHRLEKVFESWLSILAKKSKKDGITKKIIYVYFDYNAITYKENWCLKQIGLLKYIYSNKKKENYI